ncbi:unnamed protein product [Acanthoscelides obtectus]|uniref:Ig-like domain-containing protein n=1 Tax=Acanthoscelides obtectus TaxID=200917 RepID=A0A9P0M8Z2_ACAOB|nr:unnamed protein product [Acanthoscelides obtectus]CAK1653388.1 Neuronal growth regulator 1 [Acanthoscelides obtectus]
MTAFFLTVPPDILDYPTSADMVVDEGSNVSLKCIAKGSPEPSIIWKREDGELIRFSNGTEGGYGSISRDSEVEAKVPTTFQNV